MSHNQFLYTVEQYQNSASNEEYKMLDELKKLVESNGDCFERKPKNGAQHIAASVLLVTQDYAKALFLWHKKIQQWTRPGGHADGNTDIQAVALQELEEETGVTGAKLASQTPLDVYRYDYGPEVFGYKKSIYSPRKTKPHTPYLNFLFRTNFSNASFVSLNVSN